MPRAANGSRATPPLRPRPRRRRPRATPRPRATRRPLRSPRRPPRRRRPRSRATGAEAPATPYASQQTSPQAYPAQGQQPYPGQQAHPGQQSYPGQQAYPGQQQASPAQPYGSQAYSTQTDTTSKKKLGTGAIIGIIAGGVVLLLLIVLGIVALVGAAGGSSPSGGGGGDDTKKSSPEQVVTSYLEAIADGDAKTALGLMESKPSDTTLLTDEALAASNELGEIADIDVTAPKTDKDSYSADVEASFTVGGEPVSGTFRVADYSGKGEWEIYVGTIDIYLGDRYKGLGSTINGIDIDDAESVTVFPGTYELAVSNENYALSGTTSAVVSDPADYTEGDLEATVGLSESGLTAFRTAVNDSVNACVASKTLEAGCGLTVPGTLSDGTQIVDGTLTRTLSADAQAKLANLQPDEIYGDPMQVSGPYIGSVDVVADCIVDGQTMTGCEFFFTPSIGSPLVDFTTTPLTVRWD